MTLSPQLARAANFSTVKKGYDPAEVDSFKEEAASSIEAAQNQATAMEARARAAVARLQEALGGAAPAAAPTQTPASHEGSLAGGADSETISRTLLLAQRTADTTIAEARLQAEAMLSQARAESAKSIEQSNAMVARLHDEARVEARRAAEDERVKAENEVQALLARRDFLLADVDHLEQYVVAQRERLRDAAVALHDLVERVPGGLAEMRRPLLSASATPPGGVSITTDLPASEPAAVPTTEPVAAIAEPLQSAPAPEPLPAASVGSASIISRDADDLWRMLDDPATAVGGNAMVGEQMAAFADGSVSAVSSADTSLADADTAEVPAVSEPVRREIDFRIGGDEL